MQQHEHLSLNLPAQKIYRGRARQFTCQYIDLHWSTHFYSSIFMCGGTICKYKFKF